MVIFDLCIQQLFFQFIVSVTTNNTRVNRETNKESIGTDYISIKCNFKWKKHMCPIQPNKGQKCGKRKRKCCRKQKSWWCCRKKKNCDENDVLSRMSSDVKSAKEKVLSSFQRKL